MKNNLKKTFLVAGLACATLVATAASGQKIKKGKSMGSVLKPSCKPILLSTQFHKPI